MNSPTPCPMISRRKLSDNHILRKYKHKGPNSKQNLRKPCSWQSIRVISLFTLWLGPLSQLSFRHLSLEAHLPPSASESGRITERSVLGLSNLRGCHWKRAIPSCDPTLTSCIHVSTACTFPVAEVAIRSRRTLPSSLRICATWPNASIRNLFPTDSREPERISSTRVSEVFQMGTLLPTSRSVSDAICLSASTH